MIKCLALNQLKMIPKNVKNHSNCASGITSVKVQVTFKIISVLKNTVLKLIRLSGILLRTPWHDLSIDDMVSHCERRSVHLKMFVNNLSQGIFEPDDIGISNIIEEFCLGLLQALSLGSHLLLSFHKGFSLLYKLPLGLLKVFSLLSKFLLNLLKGLSFLSELSFNLTQMHLSSNEAGHFGFVGLSSFFEFHHLTT